MWIKRIIWSLLGIRSKKDLEEDLSSLSVPKVLILFFLLNIVFISIIITITRILL
ncbi:MAG: DUF2970 domain-containing protein [SAR86 cluster bacterium]|uniref:DUF2970 domain-containing protein n=1 Tax=SAR86 cluster bacterium TaxID=2030880 RepID=A0A937J6A8_9GAMM|nr:DUF2970 domain-containing protein [SAR86 cluster bacterium]MDG1202469.1 DUF2970 domain-containing protein [SAR86 cluster bacterium]MDG1721453.1 DUF2970 domain-containing protein [SAR86 cluster bacterium]